LFEARGLDVTMQQLPNGGPIPAALVGGSLQLGISTATALLQGVDAGLELVAVMGVTRQTRAQPIVSLVARKGFEVRSAADLKGKTIGAPGVNNILAALLQKWLLDNKVALNEVRIVEASFALMADQLKSGQIDAALMVDPFRARAIAAGIGTPVPGYLDTMPDNLVFGLIAATRAWATANRTAVDGFRAAAVDGLAFIKAKPDEAKAVEQKYLKVVSPQLPPFDFNIAADDFRPYVDVLKELKLLRGNIDLSKLVL
jgi:NitT/TauT family transport system substrate-binding protein